MQGLQEDDQERDGDVLTREALPAGHPIAWAVLVEGTSLHGTVWPGWGEFERRRTGLGECG